MDTTLSTTVASKAQTELTEKISRRAGWPNSLIPSRLSQRIATANGLWTSTEIGRELFG